MPYAKHPLLSPAAGTCPVTGYNVTAKPQSCGSCTASGACRCVNGSLSSIASPVSVALVGLDSATAYDVTATATNCDGPSPPSNSVVLPLPPPPAAPTILSATRDALDATQAAISVQATPNAGEATVAKSRLIMGWDSFKRQHSSLAWPELLSNIALL